MPRGSKLLHPNMQNIVAIGGIRFLSRLLFFFSRGDQQSNKREIPAIHTNEVCIDGGGAFHSQRLRFRGDTVWACVPISMPFASLEVLGAITAAAVPGGNGESPIRRHCGGYAYPRVIFNYKLKKHSFMCVLSSDAPHTNGVQDVYLCRCLQCVGGVSLSFGHSYYPFCTCSEMVTRPPSDPILLLR